MLYSAYRAFGVEPPTAYIDACARLRSAFIPSQPYTRPHEKLKGSISDSAWRGRFVKPANERLVPESEDKRRHVEAAAKARLPTRRERAAYQPTAACTAAIRWCLEQDGKLPAWRHGQRRILGSVRKSIEHLNDELRRAVPSASTARAVAPNVNVALLCALVDALEWDDTELPVNFVRGFTSIGEIPDSGVYRPVAPELSPEEFGQLFATLEATNEEWLDRSTHILRERASRASDDELRIMRGVVEQSNKEVGKGFGPPAMTRSELLRKYKTSRGLRARVMPRFGKVEPGKALPRVIDDARASSTNRMQRTVETITTPSFEYPSSILEELARAAAERGIPIPDVEIGLDDLASAYRRIPTASPEYMVAAVWDPDAGEGRGDVRYYELYGHAFGMVSSVLNFGRVPHLLCAVANRLFAAPADHFFDDYLQLDLASAMGSAQASLDDLHNAVRFPLEPKKRKASASSNVELGVECDLSGARTRREVVYSPTPTRVREVLQTFSDHRAAGTMSARDASSLLGRLNFTLSTAYGAVGRAATQPLLQRATADGGDRAFTPAMAAAHDFFSALLNSLPPKRIPIGESDSPHLIVYTDASYDEDGHSGIGIFIYDTRDGATYEAGDAAPDWLLAWLKPRGQQVNQLEAMAMACARATFPDVLHERRVLAFVDNTSALSKAVHGYANAPDTAAIINTLHLYDAALEVDAWYEWVPSAANPADLPSREPSTWKARDVETMAYYRSKANHHRRDLKMPTRAELDTPQQAANAAALAARATQQQRAALMRG